MSVSCVKNQYLHAERLFVLLAAVYELLQGVGMFGLPAGRLHLLLDVLLYLGVDEVPRLQSLEDRKAGGGAGRDGRVVDGDKRTETG